MDFPDEKPIPTFDPVPDPVGSKSLYKSEKLHKYIVETSVFPRENAWMREIREATEKLPSSLMCLPPEEAQFLELLVKMIGAKNTIEIGVFTGYSLLATALAVPEDGKVLAIDIDKSKYEDIGLPAVKKAGVEGKIEFVEADALHYLDLLLEQGRKDEFDFAFVDADKANYLHYHDRLLRLVRVGGVIAYDNTLWFGTVAEPQDDPAAPGWFNTIRRHTVHLNQKLAADDRVELSQLCMGDGLTICRRAR